MEFTAKAKKLADGLFPAIAIATKGVVGDCPTGFRMTLQATNKELKATAHGGRLASKIGIDNHNVEDLDYDCKTEGSITVNASHFADAVNSFPSEEALKVKANKSELKVSQISKTDEYQTMPVYDEVVKLPKMASDFDKEISIKRDVFLHGKDRVFFAVGGKEDREAFFYWALRTNKNYARFIAGTGARFAVLDIKGKSFLQAQGKSEILFPKEQTDVIISILKRIEETDIVIKQAKRDKDIPDQIVVECGEIRMFLVAFDPTIKYINEDKLLDAKKDICLTTHVEDWLYATKGMTATYTEEFKDQHTVYASSLDIDLKAKDMVLKTNTPLKANRHIPIRNIVEKNGSVNVLTLKCIGPFLAEVPTYSAKEGKVEFLLNNSSEPVFIRHAEHANTMQGLSESFTSFFATLNPDGSS